MFDPYHPAKASSPLVPEAIIFFIQRVSFLLQF
jgi:hypothetical protein